MGARWSARDSSAQSLDALRAFRDSLYRCFERRADALFELTDALLTAGPVPSPPHLSLAAVHRRGWGSLYAALNMGRADEAGLQDLLCRHPLEGGEPGCPPIYAVDVSVWPRCDAETSPERGYYYHPSRHYSAGQPIVAGWAYQLVAQLGFERDSWVAPVDARRVKPTQKHRRGRRRAGACLGAPAARTGSSAHLRLRRRLRSGEAPARSRRVHRADPGQIALQSGLLRGP